MNTTSTLGPLELHTVVRELKEFLRIPSVSAQPEHAQQVRRCADWLANHLRSIGLEHVQLVATPRHPIVYADWLHAVNAPTLLIYGHYDVQPAGDASRWQSPPFEPVVRDGRLFCRGSSDDKGQLFTHVKAIETLLKSRGRLPVNVKCLFEGEEEIGSTHLFGYLRRHRAQLAADAAVISDTAMPGPDRPAIIYALRGSLALELEITGPPRELHSGHFGGVVHNPLQVLAELVSKLHDARGRIAIPGMYDDVVELPKNERERLRRASPSDEEVRRRSGVRQTWGEPMFTLHERSTIRPALTINGLCGGYCGPGNKSAIPSSAKVKLSFRLVERQQPERVDRLFRQFIYSQLPKTVCARITRLSAAHPVVVNRRNSVFRAASTAYERGFGHTPVFIRSGGSIPIVHSIQSVLNLPVVVMGFGLPTDQVHSPDEHMHLRQLRKGIITSITLMNHYSRSSA